MASAEINPISFMVSGITKISSFAFFLLFSVAIVKKYWKIRYDSFRPLCKANANHALTASPVHGARAESTRKALTTHGQSDPTNEVLHPREYRRFRVNKITHVSHNVAIYRFALPLETDRLSLSPGQHVSIAATPQGSTTEVVRSYTPISTEKDQGHFEIMVKAYTQGRLSSYMTTLEIGDTVKVRGPKGAMHYTSDLCNRIGMIAGGTGITPMLQIIEAIALRRPKNGGSDRTKVDLVFANVKECDILLKDRLDALAADDDDINIYYVLNDPPPGWTGGIGFVTTDMLRDKLPGPESDVKILICGPPPMAEAMRKITESLGFQKARAVSKLEDQVFCF